MYKFTPKHNTESTSELKGFESPNAQNRVITQAIGAKSGLNQELVRLSIQTKNRTNNEGGYAIQE